MPSASDIEHLSLTDTPLDHPNSMAEAAELFRAIGLATSSWARLEMHIDMVLIHLNRPKHSKELYAEDHPIGFRSKIKLLKRWFNQHPALSHQSKALRALTPKFLELGKQRNIFLHSILSNYDPETKVATWRGIKPAAEETYRVGKHVGSVEHLMHFAAAAHEAHVQFAQICQAIYNSGNLRLLQKS